MGSSGFNTNIACAGTAAPKSQLLEGTGRRMSRLRGIPGTTELTASPGAGGGGGWWKGLIIKQGSVVLSIAVPS